MKIELPWPDSALLPNRRNGSHWSVTQNAKKQAQSDAAWATKKAKFDTPHETVDPTLRAEVTLICNPPDNRGRDVDGILSSLKPSLDAIAETLGINDRMFNPIIIYREEMTPGGRVTVIIDQIPF
jgi:crossover junction endodeoxyribonuclease RusA